MKAIFETEDRREMLRLAHSEDMAIVLWEIVNNLWREFEDSPERDTIWERIRQTIEDQGIDVNDLII